MSLKCAFWCGWSCGSIVVWLLLPDITPFVWIPALVYAAVEFFDRRY